MKPSGLQVERLEIGVGRLSREPLTFQVRPGEIAAVLGPNGSGKTTLLRTLAGLIPKRAGHMALNGVSIQFRPEMEPEPPPEGLLSLVFQDHRLVPTLTGLENILLGVASQERPEAETLTRTLAGELGAEALMDTPPKHLSFGEQEKIALLRALARKSSALLLDEPTASLDERSKRGIQGCLREWLKRRPVPVLIATHDWPWARSIADQYILFDGPRNHVAHSKEEAVALLLQAG